MSLFVIESIDKPESFDLRQSVRPTHLAYLDALGDAVVLAGPFQDEQGRSVGSMVVVAAKTLADAEALAARDPYAEAGLFETVTVRRWRWVVKAPGDLLQE